MQFDKQALVAQARRAAGLALAPYGHACYGAAVLCAGGRVYPGANVEVAGSTASCCALRVAFGNALAAGERVFLGAAATGCAPVPGQTALLCGVCRQSLAELCPTDFPVLLAAPGETGGFTETTRAALLPGWDVPWQSLPTVAEAGPAVCHTGTDITPQRLIALAFVGRQRCHAPYSGYHVGAALLAASGKVYCAGNVETAARTPAVCAERTALFNALMAGEREFLALAVVGALAGTAKEDFAYANPCAVCRQALAEFNGGGLRCHLAKNEEDWLDKTLDELLPHAFRITSYQ